MFALAALIYSIWSYQVSAAEIWGRSLDLQGTAGPIRERVGQVFLIGKIEPGDTDKLLATIRDGNAKGIVTAAVFLFSAGGDLSEGFKLGRTIRQFKLSTFAPHGEPPKADCSRFANGRNHTASFPVEWLSKDCLCASACALAWMGGIVRQGTVGLHHIAIPHHREKLTFENLESNLDFGRGQVREYLQYMRIPDWVAAKFLETPSNSIEYASAGDSEIGIDPIWSEYTLAMCGPEPRGALTYKRGLEEKMISRKLNSGEEYALELITQKIEAYGACAWEMTSKELRKQQEISAKYDKSRWSQDVVTLGHFDNLIPLADGSSSTSGHYDWWKKKIGADGKEDDWWRKYPLADGKEGD